MCFELKIYFIHTRPFPNEYLGILITLPCLVKYGFGMKLLPPLPYLDSLTLGVTLPSPTEGTPVVKVQCLTSSLIFL